MTHKPKSPAPDSAAPAQDSAAGAPKKSFPYHTVLFAVAPILFLYSRNLEEVALAEAAVPLIISLAAAGVLLALLSLLLRDRTRAGVITSMALVLFYYYGPIFNVRSSLTVAGIDLWAHRFLIPALVLAFIGLAVAVARTKKDLSVPAGALNIAGASLVVMSVLGIGSYVLAGPSGRSGNDTQVADETASTNRSTSAPATTGPTSSSSDRKASTTDGASSNPAGEKTGQALPDVYYIILDAHVSPTILKKFYKYDASDFTSFLEKKGFFVADRAHSNFAMTYLSLNSSLNMEYVNYFAEKIGKDSVERSYAHKKLVNNKVMKFFRSKGYKIVEIKSGYAVTDRFMPRDIYLQGSYLNEFTSTVLKNTLAMPFMNIFIAGDKRRTIIYAFDKLETIPTEIRGPKFVFSHIVAPHPPYVVGPNGEPVNRYELESQGKAWEHYKGYLDQLKYVDKRSKAVVNAILAKSKTPPIIIIQGDHGSTTFTNLLVQNQKLFRERMSALNVYYLPTEEGRKKLYRNITPVNSFRVILSTYFGEDLPLLDDRSYFSEYEHPYKFKDVTAVVAQD